MPDPATVLQAVWPEVSVEQQAALGGWYDINLRVGGFTCLSDLGGGRALCAPSGMVVGWDAFFDSLTVSIQGERVGYAYDPDELSRAGVLCLVLGPVYYQGNMRTAGQSALLTHALEGARGGRTAQELEILAEWAEPA